MPVNQTLSTYSDMAYATSVVVYILAMLLYFAEFSGGRTGTVARKRESALVGAGGGDSTSTPAVGHVVPVGEAPVGEAPVGEAPVGETAEGGSEGAAEPVSAPAS